MSEITTKKLSEYTEDELRAMLPQYAKGYKKVTSLPATIGEGEIVLYAQTLWRGMYLNESSLPHGTPIPVHGFLSFMGKGSGANGSFPYFKNDFANPVFTRSPGTFTFAFDNPYGVDRMLVNVTPVSTHRLFWVYAVTHTAGRTTISVSITKEANVTPETDIFSVFYLEVKALPPYYVPEIPNMGY